MELAQYTSEDSQDIVMPPIKCMKWPYDTIQEVHKRRYLLRVRKKIIERKLQEDGWVSLSTLPHKLRPYQHFSPNIHVCIDK